MPIHGLIGKKIGTTQVFHQDGRSDCVTVIQVGPCTVTQIKTSDKDGYESVQLGYEPVGRATKPKAGHLKQAGQNFRFLREIGIDDVSEVEVGQAIDVSLFEVGDPIEVTGNSKGRGFAGGVKRHGFHCGERIEPCRARPEPFCGLGFAPPPDTSARVLTLAVPCLRLASCPTMT